MEIFFGSALNTDPRLPRRKRSEGGTPACRAVSVAKAGKPITVPPPACHAVSVAKAGPPGTEYREPNTDSFQVKKIIASFRRRITSLFADKKFSEILSGSIWSLGAKAAILPVEIITSIFIARVYGAELIGLVALVMAILSLLTIVTILGTSTSVLRFIPEHMTKFSPLSAWLVYKKIFTIVLVSSLVVGVGLYLFSGSLGDRFLDVEEGPFLLKLAAIVLLFYSLMLVGEQSVRALKKIRAFVLFQALFPILKLLVLLLFFFLFATRFAPLYSLYIAIILTAVLVHFYICRQFKRSIQPEANVSPISYGSLLAVSTPMLLTAVMNYILGQTGVLVLGYTASPEEVGYYAVGVQLATLGAVILTAVNTMSAPKFSELYHSGQMDDLFYVAKKSAKLIFYTTFPVYLLLALGGWWILYYAFGSDFTASYVPMLILLLGQLVNALSGSTGIFLNMTGDQKQLLYIKIAAAVLNLCLNLWLTPLYGVIGACLSFSVSLAAWNVIVLLYIKVKYGQTICFIPFMRLRR